VSEERVDGDTRTGGAYMIATFMDDHGNLVEKEQATQR
jgi:hypothetical protein